MSITDKGPIFKACLLGSERRLLPFWCLPIVRMYQSGCHWENFRELRYWGIL